MKMPVCTMSARSYQTARSVREPLVLRAIVQAVPIPLSCVNEAPGSLRIRLAQMFATAQSASL